VAIYLIGMVIFHLTKDSKHSLAVKYLEKMNIIAIIPTKGGSKRILRNYVILHNLKSIIAYLIIEAKKSRFVKNRVILKEDKEIEEVAKCVRT